MTKTSEISVANRAEKLIDPPVQATFAPSPTERTLQVLEYIMAAGPGPIKQIDIARACSLSPSTLNRIVRSLSDWGYLFRTSEKYCVRNFRLERNVPMSETYLATLDKQMRYLSERFSVSAEVIVVAGHELLWHSKTDHPDPDVLIRANVGFRRSLYELDALARLYLSRLDWQAVEAHFYVDGFFSTVRDKNSQHNEEDTRFLTSSAVKHKLDDMRDKVFAVDLEGNHMGIRRYATVIEDPDGKFLHLLTLAEPIPKIVDDKSRVREYKKALLEVRQNLISLVHQESAEKRLSPKYHVLPPRGG